MSDPIYYSTIHSDTGHLFLLSLLFVLFIKSSLSYQTDTVHQRRVNLQKQFKYHWLWWRWLWRTFWCLAEIKCDQWCLFSVFWWVSPAVSVLESLILTTVIHMNKQSSLQCSGEAPVSLLKHSDLIDKRFDWLVISVHQTFDMCLACCSSALSSLNMKVETVNLNQVH